VNDPRGKPTLALVRATIDVVKRDMGLGFVELEQMRFTIEARKKTAVKLAATGMSQRQIAKITGAGKDTIRRDLAGANAPRNGANAPPKKSKRPVDEQNDSPGDSDETIWRRGLMFRAEEAAVGAAFENWCQYEIDRQVVVAAERAADAWKALAEYLRGRVRND
jgi:hypothetical protein